MEMHHSHHHPGTEGDTAAPEPPAGHGMVVMGVESIFFSHLPMFMFPHDWQFIARGELGPSEADPTNAYHANRDAHPDQRLYTFRPEPFVLPDLLAGPNGERPAESSFSGALFRHHFERPNPEPEPVAANVVVDVLDVVHARKLDPEAPRPEQLGYVLFGRGSELFVAHLITRPPDFDQLMTVAVDGRELSDDELRQGIPVTVPDRQERVEERLKEGEQGITVSARVNGADERIQLTPVAELYLETGELKEAM